jgi:hypothetical protein
MCDGFETQDVVSVCLTVMGRSRETVCNGHNYDGSKISSTLWTASLRIVAQEARFLYVRALKAAPNFAEAARR